jgi:hypothetical protein
MNCAVCGNEAEQLPRIIEGDSFRCVTCGTYEIVGTVPALAQWINLPPSGRLQALAKAKMNANPGELPKITSYCL